MKEESKARRELFFNDSETNIIKKFETYEKSLLWKKSENYQKNLLCIQDIADRLLGYMKGHQASFKPEITDENGKFSQEKLSGFVEELLSRWAAKQREGTFTDPSTGESIVEPYIRVRQELYGSYLYVVMRCCLCKGDYALVTGREMEVRTDFAFLLEQAKRLWRSWCVMEKPDEGKKNELFWGYDDQFGLHLYRVLSWPGAGYNNGLDLVGRLPVDCPTFLTDEGNVKRNQFKSIYLGRRPWSLAKKAEEGAQPEEGIAGDSREGEDGHDTEDGYDTEDSYGEEEGYDTEDSYDEEDGYDIEDIYYEEDDYGDGMDFPEYRDDAWYEAEERQAQRQVDMEYLAMSFESSGEYVRHCRRFVELFQQAGQDVLRGFCEDLEEIVALYLTERDIPPVMDTDKALDVYSGIYDGPYRQAERYSRGIRWKNL